MKTGHIKTVHIKTVRSRYSIAPARQAIIACLTLILFALGGCGLKPWVKPYERSNLADPVMKLDAHPVQGSYMHHVFQAREGARGAEGGAGGGCGCN